MKRSKRGFTLVELMIVLAILAIVAALAIPAYANYALKSRFTEVVLASSPTKKAIDICALTGDCVKGEALFFGAPSPFNANDLTNTAFTLAQITMAYNQQVAIGLDADQLAGATDGYNNELAGFQTSLGAETKSGFNYPLLVAHSRLPGLENSVCQTANNTSQVLVGDGDTERYVAVPAGVCAQDVYDENGGFSGDPSQAPAVIAAEIEAMNSGMGGGYMPPAMMAAAMQALAPNASTDAPVVLPCVGAGAGCSPSTKYAQSVLGDASGIITATAVSGSAGLSGETYVLIPNYSGGRVDWTASGTCKTRAGGALC